MYLFVLYNPGPESIREKKINMILIGLFLEALVINSIRKFNDEKL